MVNKKSFVFFHFVLVFFWRVCIIRGMKVKLNATANASKRTKQRIKQHGPVFFHEGKAIDARRGEWLFRAESGWFGWLPLNEFEIL